MTWLKTSHLIFNPDSSAIVGRCHFKQVHGMTEKTGKYKCLKCEAHFVSSQSRDRHVLKMHSGKQLKLGSDGNLLKLSSQEKSAENSKITEFVCTLCNTAQNSFEDLNQHMKVMHKNQKNLRIVELPAPILSTQPQTSKNSPSTSLALLPGKAVAEVTAKEKLKIVQGGD